MLHNEFDITVSYSVHVKSTGIPEGKDKSGQVIDPSEGIDYEVCHFRIAGNDFHIRQHNLPLDCYLELMNQIKEHARENIVSMIEE